MPDRWQLDGSIYAPQLLNWRRYFGERLLVTSYEQFKEDNDGIMHTIAGHVGVRLRNTTVKTENRHIGVTHASCAAREEEVPCALRLRLHQYFQPHNEALFRMEPGLRSWFVPDECCR